MAMDYDKTFSYVSRFIFKCHITSFENNSFLIWFTNFFLYMISVCKGYIILIDKMYFMLELDNAGDFFLSESTVS